jgi:hypothetical protein
MHGVRHSMYDRQNPMPPNKAQLDYCWDSCAEGPQLEGQLQVVRASQLHALRRSSLLNYRLSPIVARPRERLSSLPERCGTYRKME